VVSYNCCYATHNPLETGSETANCIGIATRASEGYFSTPGDVAGDIQLLAEDAPQIGRSKLFHGRIVNAAKLDMELARSWLHCCHSDHGERCEKPRVYDGWQQQATTWYQDGQCQALMYLRLESRITICLPQLLLADCEIFYVDHGLSKRTASSRILET